MIKTTRVRVPIESIEDRNVLQRYSAMEMAIMGAQGVPPPVGHKIVINASGKGYEIPQPVTITDARDGPWISLFELAKSRGMIGAQGSDPPPEPAKGMNGPTGNKGSPGIVGAPTWGCDPGSGEMWITGDNTIAREVGESQSYVSRDGAALSRAPEIPVTDEMIQAVRRRAMCPGWTDNVVAEFYRLMRAKELDHDLWRNRAMRSNRDTLTVQIALDAALARAEVAEKALDVRGQVLLEAYEERDAAADNAVNLYKAKVGWERRALAAETRLAERDASFNRLRWRK